MKQAVIVTHIMVLLLATSCEKHNMLLKERENAEADIRRGNDELHAMDAKFASLGLDPIAAAITLERQHSEWQKHILKQEQDLAALSKKCSDGEEELKALRPRIDSYKTKFVR
ncbi:MAG: hypothetical protein U1F71_07435 [Verrucomicrobiaceae bacterium]